MTEKTFKEHADFAQRHVQGLALQLVQGGTPIPAVELVLIGVWYRLKQSQGMPELAISNELLKWADSIREGHFDASGKG